MEKKKGEQKQKKYGVRRMFLFVAVSIVAFVCVRDTWIDFADTIKYRMKMKKTECTLKAYFNKTDSDPLGTDSTQKICKHLFNVSYWSTDKMNRKIRSNRVITEETTGECTNTSRDLTSWPAHHSNTGSAPDAHCCYYFPINDYPPLLSLPNPFFVSNLALFITTLSFVVWVWGMILWRIASFFYRSCLKEDTEGGEKSTKEEIEVAYRRKMLELKLSRDLVRRERMDSELLVIYQKEKEKQKAEKSETKDENEKIKVE
ncbi:uncharacterized protein MONOS_17470 [Monocercomonoides exilis]|uniref:uncharacterized protein n=1 Tax=Monocercomonoides exilis TaxID=2049356 RepID=UPI003559D10F|nr:hypothetical protein MONOS_17470 [Monocercomonoides exilis]